MRWSDLDLNGHVNNARVVTLLEEARIQWRAQLSDMPPLDRGHATVVASLKIDYLKSISFDSDLLIHLSVARIGTRSYTLDYDGEQDGQRVLSASTVMVPLTGDGSGARALVMEERGELNRYLVVEPRTKDIPEDRTFA